MSFIHAHLYLHALKHAHLYVHTYFGEKCPSHPVLPLPLPLPLPFPLRNQKDVALLNLANVQHQTGYSKEAVISVRMALEISPLSGIMHYMIANVYAVSGVCQGAGHC